MQAPAALSDYEKQRAQTIDNNTRTLMLLDTLKVGRVVHIPHSVFPDEDAPPNGFWIGKICKTLKGGMGDVGIHIEGEEIFTRPRLEVIKWLPAAPQEEQTPATEEPQLSPPDVSCERFRTLALTPALLRQPLPFLSPHPTCAAARVDAQRKEPPCRPPLSFICVTQCVTLCVTRVLQVMILDAEKVNEQTA